MQLTGGTLLNGTLTSASAFDLQAGTVSAVLAGTAGLAKTGAGTVTLNAANTFTGTSTVSDGTLALRTGNGRLAATGTLVVAGGTLDLGGFGQTLAAVQLDGGLISNGTLTSSTRFDLRAGTVTAVLDGNAGLRKSQAGTVVLEAVNRYTGVTTVSDGTLALRTGNGRLASSGSLVVAGGTLDLGGAAQTLAGVQLTGGDISNGTLTSSSLFDLQAGSASAVLDGTAGMAKTSAGTVTLSGANRTTGVTTVAEGTLALAGAAERLADASTLVVAGGTLDLGGLRETVAGVQLASGLISNGSLVSTSAFDLRAGTVNAVLDGTAGLNKTTAGSVALNGANRYTGQTRLSAGLLTLGSAVDRPAASSTRVVDAGTLDLGGFALDMAGVQQSGGSIVNGTLSSSRAFDLRAGNASAVLAGDAGLTKTGADTYTLSGTNTYTGTTTVSAGTLVLDGADRLAAAGLVDVAAGATLRLGGAQTLAGITLAGNLTGIGPLTAPSYVLDSARVEVPLGLGAISSTGASVVITTAGADTVIVNAGTLTLGGANLLADTAAVTVAPGATLAMNGDDRVGSLTLRGTLAGTATLTADSYALNNGTAQANLGTGTLTSQGASALNGQAQVRSVEVQDGTLRLGTAGRLGAVPGVVVQAGATLALGGNERFGQLSGAGALDLGSATVSTGSAGSSTFDGVISGTLAGPGSGGLVKQGAGTFSLTGANRYTGDTVVEAGTLALTSAERLSDATAVSVARGAVLTVAAAETVRSLALAGTLDGAGTLTAANVALRSGTANARLGPGALLSSGDSRINAPAALNSLAINTGTLTLGAVATLSASPVVTVDAGATLALGSDQTLGSLAGSGTLALGSATLSTGTAGSTIFSGVIGGSGGLDKQGDASTFTLTRANTYTGPTRVQAGTLALVGADRLADASAVSVLPGATLRLGGDDTVASLALQGTLDGSGTLTAATYTLAGGNTTAGAQLGAGDLTSTGNSRLAGTSAASKVTVLADRLTLAAPDRLADASALAVATGAALTLTGNETVGSLLLQGQIAGSGTLTAATYVIDSGTALAGLGAGALTSTGTSRLTGASAVNTVRVDSGNLLLDGADRLLSAPVVTLATGAGLALAGDNTLGSLAGDGAVALGSFTLRTGGAGSTTFSGVIGGDGGLFKQGAATTFTLTGSNTYSGTTRVAEGMLTVGDGASRGSLATSAFAVDGVLRSDRSDNVAFAQPVSGTGNVEQFGSGRLTLAGTNKTHTGSTLVSRGELATAGAENLSDVSDVVVAPNAHLVLAGDETVKSMAVDASGTLALASRLVTTGAMRLDGAVTATGGAPITLDGQKIDADSDGNRWGSSLSVNASGALTLSAGKDGANFRDLVLGTFSAGGGGRVNAGAVALTGLTTIGGATLVIDASKGATLLLPVEAALANKRAPGDRLIAFSDKVVTQTATSRIDVSGTGALEIVASQGGSVDLAQDSNQFGGGGVTVRSGNANSAWDSTKNATDAATGITYAMQSRVQVSGARVIIGGAGIEADVVAIKADALTTPAGAVIVARLPYDNLLGTANSLPGLTFELTPPAFLTPFSYGQGGGVSEININVGSQAFGTGTRLAADSGYVTVAPRGGAQGNTALFLRGPLVAGSYGFFYDGSGVQTEVPVFYNGVSAVTPQVAGSISSTVSVSESARKERFEEAVRTENVAVRLRSGVIAEVGPGTPATTSSEPLDKMRPPTCLPAGGTLGCADAL